MNRDHVTFAVGTVAQKKCAVMLKFLAKVFMQKRVYQCLTASFCQSFAVKSLFSV